MTPPIPQAEALPAPMGFCPKCHYPIDPGTCPECGTEVTEGSILTSLSQTRAAKARRWAIRIGVPVLIAVAIYGGRHVPWPQYMPSTLLLWLQREPGHWATTELAHRFSRGQLSASQISRMIENAWRDPNLSIRYTVSAGLPVHFEYEPQFVLPPSVYRTLRVSSHLSIRDDTEQAGPWDHDSTFTTTNHILVPSKSKLFAETAHLEYRSSIPARSAGTHTLTIELDVTVSDAISGVNWYRVKKSFSRTLNVVPASPFEMVEKICNPDLEKRSKFGVAIQTLNGGFVGKTETLVCITNSLEVAVAGRVEMADYEDGTWTPLESVLLWRGQAQHCLSLRGHSPRFIRLVPDTSLAMEESVDIIQILGCPLEWELGGQPGTFVPKSVGEK